MRDKDWTDILTLLCLTILVDGKVYREEMDTFLAAAKAMKERLSSGMMLTDAMLLDWFQVHRDGLDLDLTTKVRGQYLTDNILKINDPKITGPLLKCMLDISHADDEFHGLEVSMIQRAAELWGWDLAEL